MQTPSKQIIDDSALDKRCRAAVDASMDFFSLEMGKVGTPAETSLFSIISQWLRQTVGIFGMSHDNAAALLQPSALAGMLNAIFDLEVRPFVLGDDEKALRSLSTLDPEARACLLAQAIAGIVSILHRLAYVVEHDEKANGAVTTGILARELLYFARSQERRGVLDRIEHSGGIFHNCLMKGDVADVILAAVSRADVHFESPAHTPSFDDYNSDGFGWGRRPASNMGVPWGFTIMALN